jgi:hypothetical protein
MAISLSGTWRDSSPPPEGKKNRWVFKNDTGGQMHDLRVITHLHRWWDDADIVKVTVKDKNGAVVAEESYSGSVDQGVGSAHVVFNPNIQPGDEFTVTVETDDDIGADYAVIFSPSAPDDVNIQAGISPIHSSVAMGPSLGLGGVGAGMLALRTRDVALALSAKPLRYAPGSLYEVRPDDDLMSIAKRVTADRAPQALDEAVVRRTAKAIRHINGISKPVKPGDTLLIP